MKYLLASIAVLSLTAPALADTVTTVTQVHSLQTSKDCWKAHSASYKNGKPWINCSYNPSSYSVQTVTSIPKELKPTKAE